MRLDKFPRPAKISFMTMRKENGYGGRGLCGQCGSTVENVAFHEAWDCPKGLNGTIASRKPTLVFDNSYDPRILLIESHGAVQVDESPVIAPTIVTIIGPLKCWWKEWDSPRHKIYVEWRDVVRVVLVKAGCAVYSPHKAIQGSWNDKLQRINDAAILTSDFVVDLTPHDRWDVRHACIPCPNSGLWQGIEANGTLAERKLAEANQVKVIAAPPGGETEVLALLKAIGKL